MSAKAFNLRGTNGSGKTHVARALLAEMNAEPCEYFGRKIRSYIGTWEQWRVVVFGSYETQCGGCDTIPSVKIVAEMLQDYMSRPGVDLVFYEGLMISHMIGTVGAVAKTFGNRHAMGFLNTPLGVCIDRVRARRVERGADGAGFDPRNIIADHPRVLGARRNAIAQGFKVCDVEYSAAFDHTKILLRDHLSTSS